MELSQGTKGSRDGASVDEGGPSVKGAEIVPMGILILLLSAVCGCVRLVGATTVVHMPS